MAAQVRLVHNVRSEALTASAAEILYNPNNTIATPSRTPRPANVTGKALNIVMTGKVHISRLQGSASWLTARRFNAMTALNATCTASPQAAPAIVSRGDLANLLVPPAKATKN